MSKWLGAGMFVLFLCFPKTLRDGMENGLNIGLTVLMPALFPYMVASQVFYKTGGAGFLARFLKIGRLSKKGVEILVPSLFCGYPTGARLSSLAYSNGEIEKSEHRLLFSFGNVPGFGFTVSFLGGVIYQSYLLGLEIYLSYLIASVLLCGFFSRSLPTKEATYNGLKKGIPFARAFTESVTESALSMVSLIGFVCLFSAINLLCSSLSLPQSFSAFLGAFLEITSGLPTASAVFGLGATVFLVGFSGICVMFQSLVFDQKNAVNLLTLMLSRSLYGIVSVLCFYLIRLLAG